MPYSHMVHYPEPQVDLHWWNMTESPQQLEQLCLSAGVRADCDARAMSRRREILAERLMAARITGSADAHIVHNADRAPRLVGLDGHVSIAHTRTQLCVAVGKDACMGIDVENHGRRVIAVGDTYLNESERQWIGPDDSLAHLVAWTAKEAMFKAVSVRRGMRYRDQLVLHRFDPPAVGITLRHEGDYRGMCLRLITEVCPDHVLTIAWAGNG